MTARIITQALLCWMFALLGFTALRSDLLGKLLAGVDLPPVKELMGRASITTTMMSRPSKRLICWSR